MSRLPKMAKTMTAMARWNISTPKTAAAVVVLRLLAVAPMEGRAGVSVIMAKQG